MRETATIYKLQRHGDEDEFERKDKFTWFVTKRSRKRVLRMSLWWFNKEYHCVTGWHCRMSYNTCYFIIIWYTYLRWQNNNNNGNNRNCETTLRDKWRQRRRHEHIHTHTYHIEIETQKHERTLCEWRLLALPIAAAAVVVVSDSVLCWLRLTLLKGVCVYR